MHSFPIFFFSSVFVFSLFMERRCRHWNEGTPHLNPEEGKPPLITLPWHVPFLDLLQSHQLLLQKLHPLSASDWRIGGELVPRKKMCWNCLVSFFFFLFLSHYSLLAPGLVLFGVWIQELILITFCFSLHLREQGKLYFHFVFLESCFLCFVICGKPHSSQLWKIKMRSCDLCW